MAQLANPTSLSSPGATEMDAFHDVFSSAVSDLSRCGDAEFGAQYANFVSRIEQMFRSEEHWMDEMDLPSVRIHQEQHARALGALHNAHAHVLNGDIGLARDVALNLLPQWFSVHAATVDAVFALAAQVKQAEESDQPRLPANEAVS